MSLLISDWIFGARNISASSPASVNGVARPYQVWTGSLWARWFRLAVEMILLIEVVMALAAVIAAVLAA